MTSTSTARPGIDELDCLYRERGLLSGAEPPPLWQVCAHSAECWSHCDDSQKNGFDDPSVGGIFRPWVGERYEPGGPAIIGLNLRTGEAGWHRGGLAAEEKIARGQLDMLRDAERPRRVHGSMFAYRSTWALALISRWQRGLEVDDHWLPADELVRAFSMVARLQAVKCSPIGGRSHPTDAMCRLCPKHLLLHELAILRPGVLIAFGGDAQRALGLIGADMEMQDHYGRGTAAMPWGQVMVFVLAHPAAPRYWKPAFTRLVADLNSRPAPPSSRPAESL